MSLICYHGDPAGIGVLHQTSVSQTAPIHTHQGIIEAFLVLRGNALHIANNQVELLSQGTFVLVRTSDIHYYDVYQDCDFAFYNISLTCAEFDTVLAFLNYHPAVVAQLERSTPPLLRLSPEEYHAVVPVFELIAKCIAQSKFETAKFHFKAMLSKLLFQHYIETEHAPQQEKTLPSWLSALLAEFYTLPATSLTLDYLIDRSGYSQAYLNRIFQTHLQATPTQFINSLKINHATHLLRTTSVDILDICAQAGFSNASHFYRIFKKTFGISPQQYRKQHTETSNTR